MIQNALTEPVFWDVTLLQDNHFEETLAATHNTFIYVIEGGIEGAIEGALTIGNTHKSLVAGQLAVLGSGDEVVIDAAQACRFLLIAGKPLNEPVERAGPFVMNTRAEIEQAFADYRQGRLA